MAETDQGDRGPRAGEGPPAVPTLHHLACSGGTLLARAVATHPHAMVLSEIHPDRELAGLFHPFPQIMAGYPAAVTPAVRDRFDARFLDDIAVCRETARDDGRRLVIRDHAQMDFVHHDRSRSRLRDVLAARFAVCPVVTVRHPLDTYLALRDTGWFHGRPTDVFDGMARLLAAFDDSPVVRYEDFVAGPPATLGRLCGLLGLDPAPVATDTAGLERAMAAVTWLTGASGRDGSAIGTRPRRRVERFEALLCAKSATYEAVCHRLGYAPDPAAPACAS